MMMPGMKDPTAVDWVRIKELDAIEYNDLVAKSNNKHGEYLRQLSTLLDTLHVNLITHPDGDIEIVYGVPYKTVEKVPAYSPVRGPYVEDKPKISFKSYSWMVDTESETFDYITNDYDRQSCLFQQKEYNRIGQLLRNGGTPSFDDLNTMISHVSNLTCFQNPRTDEKFVKFVREVFNQLMGKHVYFHRGSRGGLNDIKGCAGNYDAIINVFEEYDPVIITRDLDVIAKEDAHMDGICNDGYNNTLISFYYEHREGHIRKIFNDKELKMMAEAKREVEN